MYFLNIRWAESLIGVSGFLISWARRWAISCQAAIFSACSSLERERESSETMRLNEPANTLISSAGRVRMRVEKSPSATRLVASSRLTMGRAISSDSRKLTMMLNRKTGRENSR
ncbi:MAG: hypothetical protein A2064_05465 [Spirochaetes bacterium GWB1_66_5]|nr:MAG: hypothetical protein A2064_05465 [Spirochaetes bacterium GWB1_66_5]